MNTIEFVHSKTTLAYNLAADKYHELFHNEINKKKYDRKLLNSFAQKFNAGSLICDAGCGPSAHIGRYLFDKGMKVIGVDICDRCIEMATDFNPGMEFRCEDIANMSFDQDYFDGIISYYSIIHTPKKFAGKIFSEFNRILKPEGYLLVAVKAGEDERFLSELLGIKTEIYFSLFTEDEIKAYLENAGFRIELLEKRNPYDFEIKNERIFAVGRKIK